jgi:hypothetical protein
VTARAVVIDTNVGIVANSKADVSRACELRCVQLLREVTESGHLVLDREGRIFAEYLRYLSLSGEPGVGDAFMRWVNDHQHDEKLCTRIPLTIKSDQKIVEFPARSALAGFDPSDEKFVAIAAVHPDKPPIQVAVDRGWIRYRDALAEAGIKVKFLCPDDIAS